MPMDNKADTPCIQWLCLECGESPSINGAYIGYTATCGCYDGCLDGNRHLYGHGATELEAVESWLDALRDDGRRAVSDVEMQASREVYLAEIATMDPPLDFMAWLAENEIPC